MLKTFIFGALLGCLAAAGVVYSVPAVDQYREVSIVSVAPNGGNLETFVIKVPEDRIMIGAPDAELPAGMVWPDEPEFANFSTEVFKIRNVRDAVIGVAARSVIAAGDSDTTEWLIHLPARGTLFLEMDDFTRRGGERGGVLLAGTREFDDLSGAVEERWVPAASADPASPRGRIELLATYISTTLRADPLLTEPLE